MQFSRFSISGRTFWGQIQGEQVMVLELVSKDPIKWKNTAESFALSAVQAELSLNPGKIIGIGDNYPRHADDRSTPVIFTKPLEALAANNSTVTLPTQAQAWPEPEIGLVIGKTLRASDSMVDGILGYILVNDITCLTAQHPTDTHSPEAKGRPGFCTLGPLINTSFDFKRTLVQGLINGVPYRAGQMQFLKWSPDRIVREVSQLQTLKPFDIIMCGCPPRLASEKYFLKDQDTFTAEAQGLGKLTAHFQSTT